jgi:hypothetical protein
MAIPALIIPAVIEAGIKVIERIFPDPNEAAKAKLALFEMQQKGELAQLTAEVDIAQAQSEINKIEAADASPFKSNWRPAIGWICAVALLYQFLIRPFLIMALVIAGLTMDYSLLDLDVATLMTLLFGILGLGWYRTAEKIKGVN